MVCVKDILKWLKIHFNMEMSDIAINGLQIENSGRVERIISAVDYSNELINEISDKYNLFLVHHGIFWGKPFSIISQYYKLLKQTLKLDSALIAIHLPLDVHLQWGNNAQLLRRIGVSEYQLLPSSDGSNLLLGGELEQIKSFDSILSIFKNKIGVPISFLPFGKNEIKKIAVCTGGGLKYIQDAHDLNVDLYITGDANHTVYHLCKDLKVNVIFGGHYNTEKWGVQSLGEEMSKQFSIPHTFIDVPTYL